jgi:hypothetical protein
MPYPARLLHARYRAFEERRMVMVNPDQNQTGNQPGRKPEGERQPQQEDGSRRQPGQPDRDKRPQQGGEAEKPGKQSS